jgi:8-oxo-dGTP pyrophosphatase MutT (NUDIX family)
MLFENPMHIRFKEILKDRCLKVLPGELAQNKLAPLIRIKQVEERIKSGIQPMHSSILIPIFPVGPELHTVLIQRTASNGVHSHQIAFPGGRMDDNDVDYYATALREANEELGIFPETVEFIGKLTDLYVPPSNFIIHPFIGFLKERPVYIPETNEVDSFFEVTLKDFLDSEKIKYRQMKMVNGELINTPYYDMDSKVVWGATAMIIRELSEILEEIKHYLSV